MTTEYGDRETAMRQEILRTICGSEVHGIAIPGTDDRDEMAVYVERPEVILGLDAGNPEYRDNYLFRTASEGERSYHGDYDLISYGLHKFVRLVAKGNPTVLVPLFAPDNMVVSSSIWGDRLREMRHSFLSKSTVHRVLGYSEGQRDRMMGGGQQRKVPNRPELIEKYGYDTKYASHALRLAYQAKELVRHGTLSLPMPEPERRFVLDVKSGGVPDLHEVDEWIRTINASVEYYLPHCRLPDYPDYDKINQFMANTQLEMWGYL